jgi:hypothetical protein
MFRKLRKAFSATVRMRALGVEYVRSTATASPDERIPGQDAMANKRKC